MKDQLKAEPAPVYMAVKGGWISVQHPLDQRGKPKRSAFLILLNLRLEDGVIRTLLMKSRRGYSWFAEVESEGFENVCPRGGLPAS